jgi:predicted metalloprotease
MRWQGGRQSTNVSDRRGMGGMAVGGGLGAVVLAIVAMLLGVDPSAVVPAGPAPGEPTQGAPAQDDEQSRFVKVVLADTEDTWNRIFQEMGRTYEEPGLVLFTGQERTACGVGQSAMGPFYCPADRKVYIDLSFYNDLKEKLGAPGDFAQAYVIAHEVGHHVQTLLGVSDRVAQAGRGASEEEVNGLSVRQELQADCFAGVWGYHTRTSRNVQLEAGDAEEALTAASAIGDDRLQQQSQGRVVPESFTHGSSEQRMRWFRRGFDTGDVRQCDSFAAREI